MNTITTAKKGWEQKNETEHYASRDFWLRLGNSNKFGIALVCTKIAKNVTARLAVPKVGCGSAMLKQV